MEVKFEDDHLENLEAVPGDGGYRPGVVKAFRKRMQLIRAAADERDFYKLKSLRFEKLKGKRAGQRSMRLNDQFRLVLRLEEASKQKKVVIVGIEDYH